MGQFYAGPGAVHMVSDGFGWQFIGYIEEGAVEPAQPEFSQPEFSQPIRMRQDLLRKLNQAVPGLRRSYTECPNCHEDDCNLPKSGSGGPMAWQVEDMIIHLNDRHCWSREAIADWLEQTGVDLTIPVPKEEDDG